MVLDSHPTFACPHCGAVYPFRPVLVDRAVRCTRCTKPFKVRADRTVEKVEDTAPVPPPETSRADKLQRAQAAGKTARLSKTAITPRPPAAAEAPVVRSPASAALTPKAPGGAVAQAGAPAQRPAESPADSAPAAPAVKAATETRKTGGKSLNEQQEEMRRRMSASLNSMAGKLAGMDEDPAEPTDAVVADGGPAPAAGTAPAKPAARDAPAAGGSARHKHAGKPADTHASATAKPRTGDTERRNSKVVLTNEGERRQREERRVGLWIAALVLVPALLIALWWNWGDAKSDALRRFAAPPQGDGKAVMAHYAETLAKRGWMVTPQLALVDAGSFSFSSGSSFPLAGIPDALSPLRGLAYDGDHDLWCKPGKSDAIFLAWTKGPDRAAHIQAAQAAIGTVIDQAAIVQDLGKGMDPAAAKIIAQLATGRSGADGHPLLDDLIGHPPTRLDLAPFTGAGSCIDPGPSAKPRPVTYQGLLMAITGPQWPRGWIMWHVTAR